MKILKIRIWGCGICCVGLFERSEKAFTGPSISSLDWFQHDPQPRRFTGFPFWLSLVKVVATNPLRLAVVSFNVVGEFL